MGTKPLTQTTGRRKEAVARVRLRPGNGKVVINGREFENYFPNALQRAAATEAFRVVEAETTYDVDCDIKGGGIAGQAGALRMAIARSILELDETKRSVLRKAGLLTRDSRKKESKKYGLKKARKAPQYTKR
ncbi:MAG: 30S ribosomal protein S9 [Actinomycetota bacterium]